MFKVRTLASTAFLALFVLSGSGIAGKDVVVARVNGEEIRAADLEEAKKGLPPQVLQQDKDQGKVFDFLRRNFIMARLLVQAAKKDGVEKEAIVKKQIERMKDNILAQAYLAKIVGPAVTEGALKAAYDDYVKSHPKDLKETRARHILVKDEKMAKSLLNKIKKGEDFLKLAREHSIDKQSGKEGGDLGYFTKDTMVPAFSAAADQLKTGDVVKEPVKTDFGYHIIRVEDRRKLRAKSFDEMKQELGAKLQSDVAEKAVKKLEDAAKIELFDESGKPVKKEEAK
jgi:peptidyl-prolyl cis-trans isomerase C